jgi:prepilin-type processing-associated H-X9-DG protein
MPTVAGIRRQAKSLACQSNLKNLYAACIMFANDHKNSLPVPTIIGEVPTDPAVAQNCIWALEKSGVASFDVGTLWKYIPSRDARRDMIWCPADDKEYQMNAGNKPDPERNMSYSFNANVRPNSGVKVAIQLRLVSAPSEKIYIWEEVGPNDAWCLNPTSNIDDHVSGRHGKANDLQYGSPAYNYAGLGNFCFFDGHVETLSPDTIYATPGYYSPLK